MERDYVAGSIVCVVYRATCDFFAKRSIGYILLSNGVWCSCGVAFLAIMASFHL